MPILRLMLLAALALGSLLWIMVAVCAFAFRARRARPARSEFRPPVSLLKPVHGLEKELLDNLRSACLQDYPNYQVVFSVQRADDPAIPLLFALRDEFGTQRVSVVIEERRVGLNGKINNLAGALPHAQHDLLVISDSDVRLRPDYLATIVAPLADPAVGLVTTFFRSVRAGNWCERIELLTINADHMALAIFADTLQLTEFCFGASTALRREMLERIGGLAALGDYLVEDHELGRRVLHEGKRLVALPYVIDTLVDLRDFEQLWQKQTRWDQNTRAAIPGLFAATLVLRTIPLSLVLLALRGFDAVSLAAVGGAWLARLTAAACVLGVALRDGEGLRSLWLLPLKDCLSMIWFARSFTQRTVLWRGARIALTRDGRLRAPAEPAS